MHAFRNTVFPAFIFIRIRMGERGRRDALDSSRDADFDSSGCCPAVMGALSAGLVPVSAGREGVCC